MIIIKTKKETLATVIGNHKHASDSKPKGANYGDIILISQTKSSLSRGEKSIRYMMKFKNCYEDKNQESKKLWGKQWKYIIEGDKVEPVKTPFNIEDIQISDKNYAPVETHCTVDPVDEKEIYKYL